ncbi:MAG: ECF transporter S component [Oscillospiraceae bacterium]|jgi:niacin transporter|nr:ECF transporter S component [Oscillospiraceae bacterium]
MQKLSTKTQKLCLAALLVALGIILPYVCHIFGSGLGKMLLPLHLPVITAGLLLGPLFALLVAVLSISLSFLLTGMQMPSAVMFPFMFVELCCYGLISGLFARMVNKNKFFSYIGVAGTQIFGRVLYAGILAFVIFALPVPTAPALTTVYVALVAGVPGIILQLAVVPVLVILAKKVMHFD